jgi:hypothetical protein
MKPSAKHIAGTKLFNNFNATFVNLLRLYKVRRKTEVVNSAGRVAQYVIENSNVTTVIVLTDGYYQNISNLTDKKYSNWNFFFIISNMNNCPKNSKKTIIEGMIK